MKKLALITALSAITVNAFAVDLKTEDQKIAYTIGSQIGDSLKMVSDNITLDQAVLFDAISDTLAGKELQLSPEEMGKSMQALQKKVIEKQSKANGVEGEKFLADNKTKDGVKVTASGLQYRVIKAGEGKKPAATDTVKVNYKGFLPDGTKFDDSADAGGPVEFPLIAMIPGWVEGLQLMPVGSTYEFVIPAELAYGDMTPPTIGPNRVLRFEVELVDILSAKTAENKTTDQSAKNTAEKTVEKVEKATEKTAVDSVKEQAKTAVQDKVDAVKEDVKTAVSETAEKVTNKATDAVKETAKDAVKKVAE